MTCRNILRSSRRLQALPGCCDNFLYYFKGTPSARRAVRPLAQIGREDASASRYSATRREDHARARRVGRQLADAGAGGLPRPPGRKPSGRGAAAMSAGPHPQAGSSRRYAYPMTATALNWPGRSPCARCPDRRAKGHGDQAGTPRIIRGGPSSVKGTRRSFLNASQKGSSGPALERRSLCHPSGPVGKARPKARPYRRAAL